jgi:hypothetical protein
MAKRVAAAATKKKAAAGGVAKAKRAAGGKKKPAGAAAAKAAGKTKPAATKAREKPATAPAAAPRAALDAGDTVAARATVLPAAALAPDVTRHDVNWGAEGAPRHKDLVVSRDGSALTHSSKDGSRWSAWAQGAVGVTRGKHYFSVTVIRSETSFSATVGWLDRLRVGDVCEVGPAGRSSEFGPRDSPVVPGCSLSPASGATIAPCGLFYFSATQRHYRVKMRAAKRPCTIGCLLDADAGVMTAFVNGKPLAQQCECRFPTDGRAWYPSVGLSCKDDALFSNSV